MKRNSMMKQPMRFALKAATLMGTLLAASCASLGGAGNTANQATVVGNNLLGEQCRVIPSAGTENLFRSKSGYELKCGNWEEPSARIVAYTSGGSITPPSIWRDVIAARANCEAPGAPGEDGSAQIKCKLLQGDWPYAGRAILRGNDIYLVDGIPAAMPAAERAVGILTGTLDPNSVDTGSAVDQEVAKLEGELGTRLFSAGDVYGFQKFLRLAQRYNYQGDHARAAEQYRQALQLQRKILLNEDYRQGQVLMAYALELSNLENFGRANRFFNQAERLIQNSIDPTDEARLTSYRALHLANQRKFKQALAMAQKATALRAEIVESYGLDRSQANAGMMFDDGPSLSVAPPFVETAYIDLIKGRYLEVTMLRRIGKDNAALEVLDEVRTEVSGNPNIPKGWIARLYVLEAEIAEDQKRLEDAINQQDMVISIQRSYTVNSRMEGLALINRGRLQLATGQSNAALESITQGLDILAEADQTVPTVSMAPLFSGIVKMPQNDPFRPRLIAQAVRAAQLVRSPVIAQSLSLAQTRVSTEGGKVSDTLRQIQDLRKRRDDIQARLTEATVSETALAAQIEMLQLELDAINKKIRSSEIVIQSAMPRYEIILETLVSADELAKRVRPDEAVVIYQVSEKRTFGFLVTQDTAQIYEIELGREDILGLLDALRYAVDVNPGSQFNIPAAADAYNMLMRPMEADLQGKERLAIVPSGPLLSLPFSMLVAELGPNGSQAYTDVEWAIEKFAITTIPSVQTLDFGRTKVQPTNAPRDFAGFSGENYDTYGPVTDQLRGGLESSGGGGTGRCEKHFDMLASLGPLPGASEEVRSIAEQLASGGQALTEQDVTTLDLNAMTESQIKAFDYSQYRVVHFATHGLLPGDLDCFPEPALALGSDQSQDPDNDGLLTASEISELNINADLVVLSACNTGALEDQYGGEGLASLTRMFLFAGARGLMVSHWAVSDKATKELMVAFFANLSQGMTGPDAMRQAKLTLLSNPETAHPFYWSPFVFIGEGGRQVNL